MIDLIVVTIDLALGPGAHEGLKVIDFVFSLYFVFEVIVRILVLTPSTFFLHIYNTLDFIIVFCTFIISCVALDGDGWVEGLALFTALRFLRIVRIFKIWYPFWRHFLREKEVWYTHQTLCKEGCTFGTSRQPRWKCSATTT